MLILLLAAVAPVAVLLYYIYLKDRRCPEPRDMLFRAFRYGIYSTFAVIVLMSPFASSSSPKTFMDALKVSFFEAGIPEEFCKWMALFILVWKSPQFDEYIDGIVYAVFISMGFACLENVMYVVEGGMNVAVSRALLSVPAHFLFAVIMGYYLSMARFHLEKRTYYMACSILFPMLAHGLFDTMAFWMGTIEYPSSYLIAFVVFVLADIWLWRVGVRKIRASVILTDKQHSDEERRSMAQAQEEAERMPVALPVSGEWTDTPIAMYQASAKEHTSEATGNETTFKLLIEQLISSQDAVLPRKGISALQHELLTCAAVCHSVTRPWMVEEVGISGQLQARQRLSLQMKKHTTLMPSKHTISHFRLKRSASLPPRMLAGSMMRLEATK